MQDKINKTKLTNTILAPVGVEYIYDKVIPMNKAIVEIITDEITTAL